MDYRHILKEENEAVKERWQLAAERLESIAGNPEIEGKLGDYFQKTAGFLLFMMELQEKLTEGVLQEASLDELQTWNRRLYADVSGDA